MKICSKCKQSKPVSEFHKDKRLKDGLQSWCKECARENVRKYYQNNKDKEKRRCYKYRMNNRDKCKVYRRKYRNNPVIKMHGNMRNRFNRWLDRNTKVSSVQHYIGISQDSLMMWFESKFKPGMTRDNYGSVWEIDHVIPLSNFDPRSEKAMERAWWFGNLQPLFISENRSKSNKLI